MGLSDACCAGHNSEPVLVAITVRWTHTVYVHNCLHLDIIVGTKPDALQTPVTSHLLLSVELCLSMYTYTSAGLQAICDCPIYGD